MTIRNFFVNLQHKPKKLKQMKSRLDKVIFNLVSANVSFNETDNKVIISKEVINDVPNSRQTMDQMSGTEFADMMFRLLEKSQTNFNNLQDASVRVQIMDMVDEYYTNEKLLLERVTKAVETMYKRPKKREEYITKTMEAQKKTFFDKLPLNYEKNTIKYFRLDESFGEKETLSEITLHKDVDILRDRFLNIWSTIKNNDILSEVVGLQFVYTPLDAYGLQMSFPSIEFIMTPQGEKEVKMNKIKLV